ncbi:aspartyl-phosphate phosphatase Spo0E family protein [Paenibacillus thiaminolyticus]|uniref:Aspartyl-phosphate phosphatase Spo0E family protein n=1 Tax=Paenibacillus thiaminolyticus TaxID=49283 RepID=A0A3A3G8F4_PANTH|nr:aspartyl-phosphate phosphatase Spo0E family protein [Paenibacillus thiaminolyticus]RJG15194.1 aspartyl-phosphate phosphatase Spo0E family protein [Paenibacillus thiaminolyticus]
MRCDDALNKVNGLRQELIRIANEKGKFTDHEVVRVSQQLDIYILEIQKDYIKRQYIKKFE